MADFGKVAVLMGGRSSEREISLLSGNAGPQAAVNAGTAHGALLQTTRGDTSQVGLSELKNMLSGGGARIDR